MEQKIYYHKDLAQFYRDYFNHYYQRPRKVFMEDHQKYWEEYGYDIAIKEFLANPLSQEIDQVIMQPMYLPKEGDAQDISFQIAVKLKTDPDLEQEIKKIPAVELFTDLLDLSFGEYCPWMEVDSYPQDNWIHILVVESY